MRFMSSSNSAAGFVKNLLTNRLNAAFTPLHFQIEDESHRHSRGGESHFKVLIVSQVFEGKSLLERHRLVNYAAKGTDPNLPCHALSIQAKTKEQWSTGEVKIQATPSCLGGDKAKENAI